MELLETLTQQAKEAMTQLLEQAHTKPGQIVVVGCSSSEAGGYRIGSHSALELAQAIFDGLYPVVQQHGMYLAAQCCEHLNRALVVEKSVALQNNWEIVAAVPMPQAGGSTAAAAFRKFKEPVLVEHIVAFGGIDIGDTFIGMHIKSVAVPIRLEEDTLGGAHVTFVKSRPKYIGGERACYRL